MLASAYFGDKFVYVHTEIVKKYSIFQEDSFTQMLSPTACVVDILENFLCYNITIVLFFISVVRISSVQGEIVSLVQIQKIALGVAILGEAVSIIILLSKSTCLDNVQKMTQNTCQHTLILMTNSFAFIQRLSRSLQFFNHFRQILGTNCMRYWHFEAFSVLVVHNCYFCHYCSEDFISGTVKHP